MVGFVADGVELVATVQSNHEKRPIEVIVLLGPPGAGKGTVASRLVDMMHAEHLSTGDLLRETAQEPQSDIGREVSALMQQGELVPDDLMIEIVKQALSRVSGKPVLLDGFPRTTRQAELLQDALCALGGKLTDVVLLVVSDKLLVARLSGRLVCPACGAVYHEETLKPRREGVCDHCDTKLERRDDDSPETVRNRLAVYREKTAPVIAWYEQREGLSRLDGTGPVEAVVGRVFDHLQCVRSATNGCRG